jgi:hypothetical protein
MATRRRAHQGSSKDELNQLNLEMRTSPWYQEWFASQGLNPDKVKLNDQQRSSLMDLAMKQGYELGDRMKIDEAGNFNQKGGWAGMHPALKAAIGGGVTAASFGLIPGVPGLESLGSIFGGGGGVANAVPAVSGNLTPTVIGSAGSGLGTTATTAAAGGGGNWFTKGLKSVFGKDGLDPTALALGGMSLLGGEEVDDPQLSLRGTTADPVVRMTEALDAIKNLTSGIQSKGPSRLRSPLQTTQPLAPVSIPGIPFQIGGGLGRDPALPDPMMEADPISFPDIFGGPGGAIPRDTNVSRKNNG